MKYVFFFILLVNAAFLAWGALGTRTPAASTPAGQAVAGMDRLLLRSEGTAADAAPVPAAPATAGAATETGGVPAPADAPKPEAAGGDPGLTSKPLREHVATATPPGGAEPVGAKPKPRACYSAGLFSSEADAEAAAGELSAYGIDVRLRIQGREDSQYLVMIPAFKSRAEANSVAESLSAKGISDYQVMSAGGSFRIALGVYNAEPDAQRRAKQLEPLGVTPVVEALNKRGERYWLEYASTDGNPIPAGIWQTIAQRYKKLSLKKIRCSQ